MDKLTEGTAEIKARLAALEAERRELLAQLGDAEPKAPSATS